MDISQGKVFFSPEAGTYLGTIVDVVDKPQVATAYGLKNKVLIKWVISQMNGAPYLNPEGLPHEVIVYVTAAMNEKSTQPLFRSLYKVIVGVLNGQQPPLLTSTTQLEQILMGRSNILMVTKEANPNKANEFYVNVVGILPMQAGFVAPQAPQGFVRSKDKPKTQAGPQGRPVQTYAVPPAQPHIQQQFQQQPVQQPQYSQAPAPNNVSFATAPPPPEAF
jgi:hypothetical protein